MHYRFRSSGIFTETEICMKRTADADRDIVYHYRILVLVRILGTSSTLNDCLILTPRTRVSVAHQMNIDN